MPHVTRYAVTILSNGTRILTGANQGRCFFDTMEEAQVAANAKKLPENAATYNQIFGPGSADTIEARPIKCHESGGDAVAHFQPLSWNDLLHNIKTAASGGQWTAVSEEMYYSMLESVPPAAQTKGGFLCGEPLRHNAEGHAVYYSFRFSHGLYFATIETLADIKPMDINNVFSFHC